MIFFLLILKQSKVITLNRFGWFNLNALSIKFDPPLEEFEELFKESIRSPLKKIEKFEKVYGMCKKILRFFNFFNFLLKKLIKKPTIYELFSHIFPNSLIKWTIF